MPRPKPNKLHDELDALLDGRPVELTDELAPLAEAADALRAELATYRLDPKVANQHLELVLHDSATVVPLPAPGQPSGWDLRRRVAAVVLAAALVLAPATMASAAALPGQPMYPFKRAIEELRIASVQWSPSREAVERTRLVDARVDELGRLVELNMFNQLLPALDALKQAVVEAKAAVDDARAEGEPVLKAEVQLDKVVADGQQVLRQVVVAAARARVPLNAGTIGAIQHAVREAQDVLDQPTQAPAPGGPPVTNPTPGSQAGAGSPGSGSSGTPSSQAQPQATPTTREQTTTTEAAPPPTTVPTTTTTAPPEPPTTDTVTPGSAGRGDTGGDKSGAGKKARDKEAPTEEAPTEETPAP